MKERSQATSPATLLRRVGGSATPLARMRLLVVEAAPDSQPDLCLRLLGKVGFVTMSTVDTLLEAEVALFGPHVVLLELAGEGKAGLELAARIRTLWPGIGLVLLTEPGRLDQRLAGYTLGADHCLGRAVAEDELLSALEALMRRLGMQAAPLGDCWVIDAREQVLSAPDGQQLELSRKECRILGLLREAPEQTANRRVLAEGLGEDYLTYDERRLEAIVSRLRRKIAGLDGAPAPIRSLRNQGYAFIGRLLCAG